MYSVRLLFGIMFTYRNTVDLVFKCLNYTPASYWQLLSTYSFHFGERDTGNKYKGFTVAYCFTMECDGDLSWDYRVYSRNKSSTCRNSPWQFLTSSILKYWLMMTCLPLVGFYFLLSFSANLEHDKWEINHRLISLWSSIGISLTRWNISKQPLRMWYLPFVYFVSQSVLERIPRVKKDQNTESDHDWLHNWYISHCLYDQCHKFLFEWWTDRWTDWCMNGYIAGWLEWLMASCLDEERRNVRT